MIMEPGQLANSIMGEREPPAATLKHPEGPAYVIVDKERMETSIKEIRQATAKPQRFAEVPPPDGRGPQERSRTVKAVSSQSSRWAENQPTAH